MNTTDGAPDANSLGGSNSRRVRAHHDWEGPKSVVTTVVTAVAEVLDEDPEEMEPLYDTVDAEAAEQFFAGGSGTPGAEAYVTFRYEGVRVTVDGDGTVEVVR